MEQKDIDKLVDAIVSHKKFDLLFSQVSVLTTHADQTDARLDALEKKVDKIVKATESLASSTNEMLLEYAAIKTQMDRHDRWLKQLAAHAGIELVP